MSVWLFAGLAALTAAVLAALQYLRIRPRQVRVITTLFWQQAVDQARARTLFERFRHPRTYLLLLAVSLLLLLGLAQPVFHDADQPTRVIVLEAGLAMTAADGRFANALELTRAEAASLDDGRVAVMAADPHPRLLKHFDESLVALEDRLARVTAADIPVVREDVLRAARSLLAGRENGEVCLVAAQPVTTRDARVRVLPAGDIFDNAFVLSAAFIPDPADLTRGAFHWRVGFTGQGAGTITAKVLRGDTVLLEQAVDFKPGEVKELAVSGIAADGSVLNASVTGADAVAGDNGIDFQLPDRRRIQVAAVDGITLPPGLTTVLDSLPEVTTQDAAGANPAVVRVGQVGSSADILIQPANASGELMAVHPSHHPLTEGLAFEDALCRAPATPLDVGNGQSPLLLVDRCPVATVNPEASQLVVSDTLFDRDASLVRRTGYVVFWGRVLRRLAGWRDEPLTLSPVQAGRSANASARTLTLKAGMSNFDLASGVEAATTANGRVRLPAWQLLLIAALALMVLEAVLNIRGRIS